MVVHRHAKKGHFFTAVVDCDAVLFAYTEAHTSAFVQGLFGSFRGYLQADASNVYYILEQGPPKDNEDGVRLVGCFAHYLESDIIWGTGATVRAGAGFEAIGG
jgi:hypothetical protein